MNFTPQLSEVRAIAAEKKYDVVPISCEILSDICTPIEAIRSLERYNVAQALMKIQEQRPYVESLIKGDLRWNAVL